MGSSPIVYAGHECFLICNTLPFIYDMLFTSLFINQSVPPLDFIMNLWWLHWVSPYIILITFVLPYLYGLFSIHCKKKTFNITIKIETIIAVFHEFWLLSPSHLKIIFIRIFHLLCKFPSLHKNVLVKFKIFSPSLFIYTFENKNLINSKISSFLFLILKATL